MPLWVAIACSKSPQQSNTVPSTTPSEPYRLSERHLTPDELDQALTELDQNIEKELSSRAAGPLYKDRRSPEEKAELIAFTQSWESLNPEILPFLGRRQIIENWFIYPSLNKGQVCLLQQYYASPTDQGVIFSTGTVQQGILKTTSKQTMIAQNGLLAVISIRDNQPAFSLWPHAKPLVKPTFEDLGDIKIKFEKSRCKYTSSSGTTN